MPAIRKTKDLHLAKSLEGLRKIATSKDRNILNQSVYTLSKSALKLYEEGSKQLKLLDEEMAYILLFRCVSVYEEILKKPGGKDEAYFSKINVDDAMEKLEDLSDRLHDRYIGTEEPKNIVISQNLSTGDTKDAGMISNGLLTRDLKEGTINNGIDYSSSEKSLQPIRRTAFTESPDLTRIDCIKLEEMMQDSSISLLIFDARPEEDFLESHIKHHSCINIPAHILKPGSTAAALGTALPTAAKAQWNKRSLVDFVILLDYSSTRETMVENGPLHTLNMAISKWSINNILKSEPLILDNGFSDWMLHFPTITTKAIPTMPLVSLNDPEYPKFLPYIDVEYPDLDETLENGEEKLMNTAFDEHYPSKEARYSFDALQDSNTSKAFFIERHNDNSFIKTTAPQVPRFDRKSKPTSFPSQTNPKVAWAEPVSSNGGNIEQVLQTQNKLYDGDIRNLNEQLKKEKEFDELRRRRESEADQVMREEMQRIEEDLLQQLKDLQEENKQLQDKWKASEDEKEYMKKQIENGQNDEILRITMHQKQQHKKHLDEQIDRLRKERKKREQREKEALKAANEKAKRDTISAEINQLVISSPKAVSSPKTINTPTIPPKTLSDVSSSVPNTDLQQGDVSGNYSARLKDADELPSLRRGLSRSYSSPNIAQLLAKEDQKDASPVISSAKTIKPTRITDTSSPNINRSLKPVDPTVARMRNFSPVYSSQPNTQTGLKNLGNTCYMNSVLQCLHHTKPLALYLVSGAYLTDIKNAEEKSNGAVIHELSSVVSSLHTASYRSISPFEFKATLSRYMSICVGYEQQDAHEFLVVLLDKLHSETNKGLSNKGPKMPDLEKVTITEEAVKLFWQWHIQRHNSHIVRVFEGVLQSRLTCASCGHRSYNYEVFSCLSLPIPSHNKCSLKDCIQSLLKAETMRGEAAWDCPICKQKQEAEKKMGLCRLPQILIIHLKRFSYEGLWRRKLTTSVDFPLHDLDMQPYVTIPAQTFKYNLYGVVNHYGTLEGGHYTAFCKSDKWFKFDDHDAQAMPAGDVKTSAGYILFYASADLKYL